MTEQGNYNEQNENYEHEYNNPFFIGKNKEKLNCKEIYKNYKYIYILCLKNNKILTHDASIIYSKKSIKYKFIQICNEYFDLIKCDIKLINIKKINDRTITIKKNDLDNIFNNNDFKNEFQNTELVSLFCEIERDNLEIYLKMYENFNLKNMEKLCIMGNYINGYYEKKMTKKIIDTISNINEFSYWNSKYNCNINMTHIFKLRNAKFKQLVLSNNQKNKNNNEYTFNESNVRKYYDIYDGLHENNKRTYFAKSDNYIIEKYDVINLINIINNEYELFNIVNSFLVSKDYSHYIVNNIVLLDKLHNIFTKYMPFYKYLFGYTWLSLYIDECIFKTKTTKNNRYVFDINTANKLPVFPLNYNNPEQNPYLILCVNKNDMMFNNNFLSINAYNYGDNYGVCNLDTFVKRFNIFSTGDENISLFNNINWNIFGVTGSAMTACCQKNPILINLIDNINDTDTNEMDKFKKFIEHYYSDSDIDLMCNTRATFDFMKESEILIEKIKENLNIMNVSDDNINNNNNQNENFEVKNIKSNLILCSEEFFEEHKNNICNYMNAKMNTKEIIKKIDNENIKTYIYDIYVKSKYIYNEKNVEKINSFNEDYFKVSTMDEIKINITTFDKKYNNYNNIEDNEIVFRVNDFRTENNKVSHNDNNIICKILQNIKYKISSPKISRTIELFHVKPYDFFATVSKFHLPCVRAYYQNNNVYMLPSFITAMMTNINIDYKYIAGCKDPVDIFNKNRMRGFGTIFNNTEKKYILKFNTTIKTKGEQFYCDDIDNAENIIFGSKDINNKIYKPLINNEHMNYNNITLNYTNTLDELKDIYKTKYNYENEKCDIDIFKFTTINSNGTVNPYKKWIQDEIYNFVNNN
jgi:hypothetical protein